MKLIEQDLKKTENKFINSIRTQILNQVRNQSNFKVRIIIGDQLVGKVWEQVHPIQEMSYHAIN